MFSHQCYVQVDDASGRFVASVSAGLSGLLGKNREHSILSMPAFFFFFPVLKSTGSRFEGFVNDEFTTLIPVNDRIFSTSIDLTYTFKPFTVHHKMSWEGIPIPVREEEEEEGGVWDEDVASQVRKTTMEVFAMDDSASVQVSVALHELREREDEAYDSRRHCTKWDNGLSQKTGVFRMYSIHCRINIIYQWT